MKMKHFLWLRNATVMELWTKPRCSGLCQTSSSLCRVYPEEEEKIYRDIWTELMEMFRERIFALPESRYPRGGELTCWARVMMSILLLLKKVTTVRRR